MLCDGEIHFLLACFSSQAVYLSLMPSESAIIIYFAGLQLPHYFIAVHSWLIQLVLCNRSGAQCALYLPALVAYLTSLLAVTV